MLIKRVKEVEETIRLSSKEVCKVFEAKLEELIGPYEMLEGQVVLWSDTGHGSGYTETIENPDPVLLAALRLKLALESRKKKKL